MESFLLKFGLKALKKKNVVGYSGVLLPKIVDDKVTSQQSFRVYVSEKVDLRDLKDKDAIPACVEDIPTDVVSIGDVKALSRLTDVCRPIERGTSIGHYSITAGSYGMSYTKKGDQYLTYYGGSNAHVLTPDPSRKEGNFSEYRILQPGAYHGGQKSSNVVGSYQWHKQVIPEQVYSYWLALLYRLIGKATDPQFNHIDFATFKPFDGIVLSEKFCEDNTDPNLPFIGHLFAGSDVVGIICKVSNIIKEGWIPTVPKSADVYFGDTVHGNSFWGNWTTNVVDPCATVRVGYDGFSAVFSDVIFVNNVGGPIRGGWSGSGWVKVN